MLQCHSANQSPACSSIFSSFLHRADSGLDLCRFKERLCGFAFFAGVHPASPSGSFATKSDWQTSGMWSATFLFPLAERTDHQCPDHRTIRGRQVCQRSKDALQVARVMGAPSRLESHVNDALDTLQSTRHRRGSHQYRKEYRLPRHVAGWQAPPVPLHEIGYRSVHVRINP